MITFSSSEQNSGSLVTIILRWPHWCIHSCFQNVSRDILWVFLQANLNRQKNMNRQGTTSALKELMVWHIYLNKHMFIDDHVTGTTGALEVYIPAGKGWSLRSTCYLNKDILQPWPLVLPSGKPASEKFLTLAGCNGPGPQNTCVWGTLNFSNRGWSLLWCDQTPIKTLGPESQTGFIRQTSCRRRRVAVFLCCKRECLDYVGEGEGGTIWKNSIETCTLPYVKEMTSANSMYGAGPPKVVLWDNPEGWGGEGGGRGVQEGGTHGLIHVDVWEKLPQCCN